MNVTKLAGYLLLGLTVAYAVIAFMDFGPDYAAAGAIGEDAQKNGLDTTSTNLRFHLGFRLVTAILIIAVMGIAGWWLTTSEVIQIIWIVIIGVFLVFSIVIRASPVLPMEVLKRSPSAAFYGAQVQLPIVDDLTMSRPGQYFPVTRKTNIRIAQAGNAQGQAGGLVALEMAQSVSNQYNGCTLPLTLMGSVKGTISVMYASGETSEKHSDQMGTTVLKKVQLLTLPLVVPKSAQSGLPQRK